MLLKAYVYNIVYNINITKINTEKTSVLYKRYKKYVIRIPIFIYAGTLQLQ